MSLLATASIQGLLHNDLPIKVWILAFSARDHASPPLIKLSMRASAQGSNNLTLVRPMTSQRIVRKRSVLDSHRGQAGAELGAERITLKPARSRASVTSAG